MACLMACCSLRLWAAPIDVTSPNGNLKVTIDTDKGGIGYTVSRNGRLLIAQEHLALLLTGERLDGKAKPTSVKKGNGQRTVKPVVALKEATVDSRYNYVLLGYKGSYSVEFRVMDNGMAYRFSTTRKGAIEVVDEPVTLTPAPGMTAHLQTAGSFRNSYEEPYRHLGVNEWTSATMATSPLLLSTGDGTDTQVLIAETGVLDYPHMFLRGDGKGRITSLYPKAPLKWELEGDRGQKITEEAPYMAKTSGTRHFPWRYMVVGDSKDILAQNLTAELSEPCALQDASWVRPGKVSWEWWNGAAPYGPDVKFKVGCNTDTYKYYVDFASKYGVEYIILDEGWAKSIFDPYHSNDQLDLQELISYGKEKNVGIILWLTWYNIEKNPDLLKTFASWGVKGVKVDFMDHADQWMVNFYSRTAKEAAKYKLLVDFHGAYTPAGQEFVYPNLISYEGVRGLENMGGCRPENTIYLPFIRNAVGPMDFTPGSMINMQPEVYSSERPNSASMGTRTFNMAMFVVFESGVQMLCDNPTLYYKNDESTRYIASVPVTWDETRVLAAEAGKYMLVARRKGNKWYLGGMNGDGRGHRRLSVKLDFLGSGAHKMSYFYDGANADRQAMDYVKADRQVDSSSTVDIDMARNGGWCAVIE